MPLCSVSLPTCFLFHDSSLQAPRSGIDPCKSIRSTRLLRPSPFCCNLQLLCPLGRKWSWLCCRGKCVFVFWNQTLALSTIQQFFFYLVVVFRFLSLKRTKKMWKGRQAAWREEKKKMTQRQNTLAHKKWLIAREAREALKSTLVLAMNSNGTCC